MDNDTTGRTEHYDEIDLRELFSVLWEGKISILLVLALSAVISVAFALSLPNKYKSEALLAPRAVGFHLRQTLPQEGTRNQPFDAESDRPNPR